MSSESEDIEATVSLTPHKTPIKTFRSPFSGRPKPVFPPEPKTMSTKKVSIEKH